MSNWVKIEKSVRKRHCHICGREIEPKTEVFKIYLNSFHPRCLFKELAVAAGKERYDKLLNEWVADKV